MTSASTLPPVQECSVGSCGYNAESTCHAGAITVSGDHAHCGTFVEIGFRAGLERTGQVDQPHVGAVPDGAGHRPYVGEEVQQRLVRAAVRLEGADQVQVEDEAFSRAVRSTPASARAAAVPEACA